MSAQNLPYHQQPPGGSCAQYPQQNGGNAPQASYYAAFPNYGAPQHPAVHAPQTVPTKPGAPHYQYHQGPSPGLPGSHPAAAAAAATAAAATAAAAVQYASAAPPFSGMQSSASTAPTPFSDPLSGFPFGPAGGQPIARPSTALYPQFPSGMQPPPVGGMPSGRPGLIGRQGRRFAGKVGNLVSSAAVEMQKYGAEGSGGSSGSSGSQVGSMAPPANYHSNASPAYFGGAGLPATGAAAAAAAGMHPNVPASMQPNYRPSVQLAGGAMPQTNEHASDPYSRYPPSVQPGGGAMPPGNKQAGDPYSPYPSVQLAGGAMPPRNQQAGAPYSRLPPSVQPGGGFMPPINEAACDPHSHYAPSVPHGVGAVPSKGRQELHQKVEAPTNQPPPPPSGRPKPPTMMVNMTTDFKKPPPVQAADEVPPRANVRERVSPATVFGSGQPGEEARSPASKPAQPTAANATYSVQRDAADVPGASLSAESSQSPGLHQQSTKPPAGPQTPSQSPVPPSSASVHLSAPSFGGSHRPGLNCNTGGSVKEVRASLFAMCY
jgi:hypothetical protein